MLMGALQSCSVGDTEWSGDGSSLAEEDRTLDGRKFTRRMRTASRLSMTSRQLLERHSTSKGNTCSLYDHGLPLLFAATGAEHDTRKNVTTFGSPIRELLPAGYMKLSGVALDVEMV